MGKSKAPFPLYPAYKPSGAAWLGDIPAHWEVRRLKFLAEINPSKSEVNHLPNELQVTYLPMDMVGFGEIDVSKSKPLSAIQQGFTYIREGDVIVAKITPSFENGKGAVAKGLKNGIAFGTTELHVIRPKNDIDNKFLYYVTVSHSFRESGAGFMEGTAGQKRVPDAFIANFPFPLPPLPEQRAIARFLDRETGRIDALIARKQRLIELLREKRAALITRAVTRGLNPDAPLKDSGVPWLGNIPGHWEVAIVKRFFKIDLGKMLDSSRTEGVMKPYLRAANIFWEGVRLDNLNTMRFRPSELQRYRLQPGDVLVTEGGVTVGRTAIWRGELDECYYQNSLNRARPKGKVPPEWLFYWLYFLKHNGFIDTVAEKSTFGHLTKEKLEWLPIVIPPQNEMQRIIDSLEAKLATARLIENKIEASIETWKEYRTALITAAVTGKIDVREKGSR